ncbi:MAG: hypothetical protein J5765_02700 [Clostridia bacterium]|nr:hypothetical protein [Clostridia bacterium]
MAAKKKSYGFDRIINLILAIIPITNIILGIVKRVQFKSYIGAILNFFLAPVFYVVDLITVILNDEIWLLA